MIPHVNFSSIPMQENRKTSFHPPKRKTPCNTCPKSPPPVQVKKFVSKNCLNKRVAQTVKIVASASFTYYLPHVAPVGALACVGVSMLVPLLQGNRPPMSLDTFRAIFKGGAVGLVLKTARFLATGEPELLLVPAVTPLTKIFHTVYPLLFAGIFHRFS